MAGLRLWGKITGIWEVLRSVTPETAEQWLAIWKADPTVTEKYEQIHVSKNKPRNPLLGRRREDVIHVYRRGQSYVVETDDGMVLWKHKNPAAADVYADAFRGGKSEYEAELLAKEFLKTQRGVRFGRKKHGSKAMAKREVPLPCKLHHGEHRYDVCAACGKQFCPEHWASCPRCEPKLRRGGERDFLATEWDLSRSDETGRTMEFLADSLDEAAESLAYTLNLSRGGWKVASSRGSVYRRVARKTGDLVWVVWKAR